MLLTEVKLFLGSLPMQKYYWPVYHKCNNIGSINGNVLLEKDENNINNSYINELVDHLLSVP